MEMLMAALLRDRELIPLCCGCTAILEQRGMVRRVAEAPLPVANEPPGTYSLVTFEIAFPYTVEGCREAIADRHIGPPWGELPPMWTTST
jgi:hypothetical protein